MKKVKLFLMAITMITFIATTTSCSKEEGCTDATATNYDSEADEDDGSCTYKGRVIFWQKSGDGFPITSVTCNGQTKSITGDYASSPSCGQSGGANFEFAPGTYSFTATGGNDNWSGSITVIENTCIKNRLK